MFLSLCALSGTSEIKNIAFNNQSTMLFKAMVPICVHSECIIILELEKLASGWLIF